MRLISSLIALSIPVVIVKLLISFIFRHSVKMPVFAVPVRVNEIVIVVIRYKISKRSFDEWLDGSFDTAQAPLKDVKST